MNTSAKGATSSNPLSLSPGNLSFGDVTVGATSSTQTIVLYNPGKTAIAIASIVLTGPFLESNTCDGLLSAKSSCTISVQFRPISAGAVKQNLIVSTAVANGTTPYAVSLSGNGIGAPILTVSTSNINFKQVTVGTVSAARSVSLTNIGSAALSLSKISTSASFSQSNTCGTTLAIKATCVIDISFQPQAAGTKTGSLRINDNAAGAPHLVTLTGSGLASSAVLTVTPATLVFPSQAVGSTSASRSIDLVNTGTAPFIFGQIALTGDFSQQNNCPSTLALGARCSVSVAFSPTTIGSRGGTLDISQSGSVREVNSVVLSGAATGVPLVTLSTSSVSFPSQGLGIVSAPQSLTLTNRGTADLAISSFKTTGDFGQTNTCGVSLASGSSCKINLVFQPASPGLASGSLVISDSAAGSPHVLSLGGIGSNITGVWANEGGDKVAREELRATKKIENLTGTVKNRAWDGQTITLTGAHNEVVSFNLVLEAGGVHPATGVTVAFDTLTGPNGVQIHTEPTTGNGVFEWVKRPIELFYVRYVQIKGLSTFGYGKWDERQTPVRFQRPWVGAGNGFGLWTDRPDHDKFYPDAMVPNELAPEFDIAIGQNQSIWSDIYIPKKIAAGTYRGTVTVKESGTGTLSVPVQLVVNNFSLPDAPAAKTMIQLDTVDIPKRYIVGWAGYANWMTPEGQRSAKITDRYFELFHRHKLSLIGQNECPIFDHPCDSSLPRLTGSLFNPANGYDGPGVNTGTGIFSIGTYNTWGDPHYGVPGWKWDQSLFWAHTNAYVDWFEANLPQTDYHLYLSDEPHPEEYATVNTWAQWIKANPGSGQRLKSVVTHQLILAKADMPDVDIPIMPAGEGVCPGNVGNCDSVNVQQAAANFYKTQPRHELWVYNDGRPGVGTSMTEDDGVSMRTIAWAQYKKKIDRWFYWYANVNDPKDWYAQAVTWGNIMYTDPSLGQTGNNNTSNGNGLLVYPGSTVYEGQTNWGVDGPIASLRMKEWRRGIQDADYLTLAAQYDPITTNDIVNQLIPYVLWEYPTTSPSYYTGGGPSWSTNPDTWEGARAQLAKIISDHCASNPGDSPCQ